MRATAIFCSSLLLGAMLCCPCSAQEHTRTFHFEEESLRNALDSLMQWYGVSVVYFDSHIAGMKTTCTCTSCSVADALGEILRGSGLLWSRMGNQFVLRPRPAETDRVSAALSGVVSDSVTGGGIAGATVLLQKPGADSVHEVLRWCPTNSFGFFSFPDVEGGEYLLTVRAVGYAPATSAFGITGGDARRMDVVLRQEEISLQEFTVEGHRTESVPAGGLVRGTYIRSIPSDQTQYMLDGARIYNPAHFGGVLSTFQPGILNDVESEVSGLSPFYGGRIGGLMDLSIREGSKERISGSAGVGTLGTHLFLEGPAGDRSTFLVSGRRAFIEPVIPFLGDNDLPGRSGSYEIIGKMNYRLSDNSRLFLSGYLGGDTYANGADGGGKHLDNVFTWSNQNLQCRWFGISSSSLFLFCSLGYSRYDLTLDHTITAPSAVQARTAYTSAYRIEDVSLRAHAEHFLDRAHSIRGGVELVGHIISGTISEFSLANAPLSLEGLTSWELAVYGQDQWRISDAVTVELGARATSFMAKDGSRSSVDPRFSLLAALTENTRLYSSLTAINQFIHPYRNTGVFYYYPTVFWYPSDDEIKPTTSLHVTAGIERTWGADAYVASAEAYYRTTRDYHGFMLVTEPSAVSDLRQALLYGSEQAFGGSVSVRKRFGVFTGSVQYTLGWLFDRFAEVNNGKSFAPAFDRRHEVELWMTYAPADDWSVSAICVLASEPPALAAATAAEAPVRNTFGVTAEGARMLDANGSKTPGFERLEFNVMKRIVVWGAACQLSLRMLNAYGLLDPFVWSVNPSENPRAMWAVQVKDLRLLPLYPSVGLHVRF
jgi:hypothetical protein